MGIWFVFSNYNLENLIEVLFRFRRESMEMWEKIQTEDKADEQEKRYQPIGIIRLTLQPIGIVP
jgi:hypothetical protein